MQMFGRNVKTFEKKIVFRLNSLQYQSKICSSECCHTPRGVFAEYVRLYCYGYEKKSEKIRQTRLGC